MSLASFTADSFPDAAAFVKAFNAHRLANRHRWIGYVGTVAGRAVEVKSFDHGDLQRLRVDGLDRLEVSYGLTVGGWKDALTRALS